MKNQHCEYCQVCDKNIIPFPKHLTKEAIARAKSIKRILERADKLNW